MSAPVEDLYQRIQSLALRDRLDLLGRIFADLKATIELQEEFTEWERLSDEALDVFEKNL
ncbi:MAG: hypothetical protein HW373_626 [Deltaproteobacteria bacterium]|nr:hypothetical protein [Deltaproteobacteria bacterium]